MQTDQMQPSVLCAAQAVNTRIPACHVLSNSQQHIMIFSGSCKDVVHVLNRVVFKSPGRPATLLLSWADKKLLDHSPSHVTGGATEWYKGSSRDKHE